MNPGPAMSTEVTGGSAASFGLDQLGQRARIGSGGLGEHHRRVGREVAMRRVARRLDRHVPAVEVRRKHAFGNKLVEHSIEERGILGVDAQLRSTDYGKRGPLAQPAPRVTRQAMRGCANGRAAALGEQRAP